MLVVMRHDATAEQVESVARVIEDMGYQPRPIPGAQRTAVGVVGNDGRVDAARLGALPGVREIVHITKPYRQVSREWKSDDSVIALPGGVVIGGRDLVVIAGPCSVESKDQILEVAQAVRECGAAVLRGGAFKPRSSPYSFQGLGQAGLDLLAEAREHTGLAVITEAMDPESVSAVQECADIIQVGSRNMQNFSLLKKVGRASKPTMLKRGLAATVTEWLLSAEYLVSEGNHQVMLCERGIRGFDGTTRNLFDVTAIPATQSLSHLPVIADPSHGTGRRDLVPAMARAATAAGAHGLMIEVHPDPERARSDGDQTLSIPEFATLMQEIRAIAEALGRGIATPVRQAVG